MEIYDIKNLKRDEKQNNLYNFFVSTFARPDAVRNLNTYVVSEENFMRMDSVSKTIFGNQDAVDFLCNLNEIDNPLNILPGDEIQITTSESITVFRYIETLQEQPQALVDPNKSTKIDPNRQSYVENNYSAAPTQNSLPFDPVRPNQGSITITP